MQPESRQKVNTLLGYGLSPREIHSFIADINEKRPKRFKITVDSIRNHKTRHFNIQAPTQAGFRRILEKRRAQMADEFAEGAASLLTGMAYLDVVAQKGWQNLIREDTVVNYETGLKAILQLEAMQREGQIEHQIAEMRRDVSLLQQAVKDVLADDPEKMQQIIERIDELTGRAAARSDDDVIDAEVIGGDDEDDEDDFFDQEDNEVFAPVGEGDERDSLEG